MKDLQAFGRWLKKLRAEHDLTQEMLAEQIGCATQTLRSIELGSRRPSREMAERIAAILHVPTEQQSEFVRLARQAGEIPPPVPNPWPAAQFQPNPPSALTLAGPLIGREAEVNALCHLLRHEQQRLVTIVGAGGMGKTRLALAVAANLAADYRDGVVVVALAAVMSAQHLPTAIADACGIALQGALPVQQQVLAALQNRHLLLVLDNFEQLLGDDQAVAWVNELLPTAPALRLIVTSRERLRIRGERVFALAGLSVPTNPESTATAEAVQFFVTCAQRADRTFVLDAENRQPIAQLAQLVEGMPLALELAAAWLHVLSPQEIVEEVARNVAFLASAARDQAPRHQSIAAVFEHSWRLLNGVEQQVLMGLALFRGGCQREAAQQVANATLPILANLIDKSLLQRSETRRYHLHEVIRQLVWEQVVKAGQAEAGQRRHLAYFYAFAQSAAAGLLNPNGAEWLTAVDQEVDNLRAALTFAFTVSPTPPPEQVAQGLELVADLYSFWQGRGYLTEARAWLEQGLQVAQAAPPAVLAKTLNTLGWLANQQGATAYAVERLVQSLGVYRQLQDEAGLAETLDALGDAAWASADLVRGVAYYTESLALRRATGKQRWVALSLYSLGRLYVDHRQIEAAAPYLHEALTLFAALGDPRGLALTRNALGRLAWQQQNYGLAAEQFKQALQLFHQLVNKVDIAECFEELALVAYATGARERATTLWQAGAALRATMHVPSLRYNQELAQPLLAELATQPPISPVTVLQQRTLDEWVAYALSESTNPATSAP